MKERKTDRRKKERKKKKKKKKKRKKKTKKKQKKTKKQQKPKKKKQKNKKKKKQKKKKNNFQLDTQSLAQRWIKPVNVNTFIGQLEPDGVSKILLDEGQTLLRFAAFDLGEDLGLHYLLPYELLFLSPQADV